MTRFIVLLCVILATQYTYQSTAPSPTGCVELDEISFDKVTRKFEASLVKFDVAYPYGDKHEAFVSIAKDANDVDELLVAEVGVKDYGEKDNEGLARKYGATKENFPVVKLFVKGKSEPITFDDKNGFTSIELRRFIRENTGLYLSFPGCVKELDQLSIQFMKSKKDERKVILKKVEDVQEKLTGKEKSSGKIYKAIMEKILDKGDKFVTSELERVRKLLSQKVSNEKKKELEHRINILQTFKQFDANSNPKSEL